MSYVETSLVREKTALLLLVLAVACGPQKVSPKAAEAERAPDPTPSLTISPKVAETELPSHLADLPFEDLEAELYEAIFGMGMDWGVEHDTDNSVDAFRQKDLSIFAGQYTAELRLRSFGNPALAGQHPIDGNHARVGGPYQLDVEAWHTAESNRILQVIMPAGTDISDIRLEVVKQVLVSEGYKISLEERINRGEWIDPEDASTGIILQLTGNGRAGTVLWRHQPGTEEEPLREPCGLNHGAVRRQGGSKLDVKVHATSVETSTMVDALIAKALELWTICPALPGCPSRSTARDGG